MMIHKLISTIGLGILGVDPFTAVYLLSMGLRQEKKSNITLFFLSYAGFSVFIGAILSAIFGATAVDILKSIVPGDNSPFWAVLEFTVSVFIPLIDFQFYCGKMLDIFPPNAISLDVPFLSFPQRLCFPLVQ